MTAIHNPRSKIYTEKLDQSPYHGYNCKAYYGTVCSGLVSYALGIVMLVGLVLSIWTIVYMRSRGKGNPMDAFGHEVAPRTQHLMIDGPYKINRNPMLTGTLIYLAGAAVWLWSWQACAVFVVFFAIMMVQVLSEEKRLRRDFGEEYEEYCKRSRRF